jgi:hypothetical protein
MTTVFTDAGKVAGFIIQRGRIGFETFRADEKSAGVYAALRELAAQVMPDAIYDLGAPTSLSSET